MHPSRCQELKPSDDFRRPATYSHISTYRSTQMELHLYSQYTKIPSNGLTNRGNLPVFGEHDQVRGKVILSRNCYHTGYLSISIEGAFLYAPTGMDRDDAATKFSGNTEKRKYVFLSSSTVLRVSPDSNSGLLHYPFRHAFTRRRPSVSSLDLNAITAERSFSFAFELPGGCRPGEAMPPSFAGSLKSDISSEFSFDVTYTVKIMWEAHNDFEAPRTRIFKLEAQILFWPDKDVQSAGILHPTSWLEMPLTSDRPIPFRCAVSLPASLIFTRRSSIPYFAIFKTISRSADLAKEIASDATISVSLLRQVIVTTTAPPTTLSPSHTPDSLTGHSDLNPPRPYKFFLRSGHSKIVQALKGLDNNLGLCEKALPSLPARIIFSESRILQNRICIGFPKRPRCQIYSPGGHPSLNSQASLPDGLHKSEIKLHEGILPSISWEGVRVKYYLDVSVLVGQDNCNARIPIRII